MSCFVITGSEGRIGRALMEAFPGSIGIDVAGSPNIKHDLTKPFSGWVAPGSIVIHLAAITGNPQNEDFSLHAQSILMAENVLSWGLPTLVASSIWAGRSPLVLNPYTVAKLAIERLALQKGQRFLRFGWYGWTDDQLATANPWLAANAWTKDELVQRVKDGVALLSEPMS